MGSQRSGKRLSFRQRSLIIKTGQVDLVESLRQEVKERMGQGTKVDQNSSGEVNKLDEISSNGHYVTSARDDILVIVMIHQDTIIAGKLAI